jgi:hypothetical protein
MNDTTSHQLQIIPVVECPWCDAWTELADGAPALRCDGCGLEAEIALPDHPALAAAA